MLLKWCTIFDSSPLLQNSKFNNFLWVCWFLCKNISNFVPLIWKLHNPYCHNGNTYHIFWVNVITRTFLRPKEASGSGTYLSEHIQCIWGLQFSFFLSQKICKYHLILFNSHTYASSIAANIRLTLVFWPKPRNVLIAVCIPLGIKKVQGRQGGSGAL